MKSWKISNFIVIKIIFSVIYKINKLLSKKFFFLELLVFELFMFRVGDYNFRNYVHYSCWRYTLIIYLRLEEVFFFGWGFWWIYGGYIIPEATWVHAPARCSRWWRECDIRESKDWGTLWRKGTYRKYRELRTNMEKKYRSKNRRWWYKAARCAIYGNRSGSCYPRRDNYGMLLILKIIR